jgi:hypothetical protein
MSAVAIDFSAANPNGGTYVTRERVKIQLTLSNGNATSYNLELMAPNGTVTTYPTGSASITVAGSGVYYYTMVPTDLTSGEYKYRWWGVDSVTMEFVAPSDKHWQELFIE